MWFGACEISKHGLICSGDESEQIDLSNVEIFCAVTDFTSSVRTTCTYKNNLDHPIEAKYVFPLNEVSLYSFEAIIDDRRIVAECRPRAEAKETYDDAIASGHSAFMAEQDAGCEDVFQMKLGNIPSQSTVVIVLKYVGQIEAENVSVDGKTRSQATFTLPSVLNPRYTPSESKIAEEFDPITTCGTVRPYSITFKADINMPVQIVNVSSPRDNFDVNWTSADHKVATVQMSSEFKADHDLQMVIEMNQRLESFAVCEQGDPKGNGILSKDCLMAQFMPDFSQVANELETRTELYFVIDRSGSMSGSNIQRASESLLLFIKSLPPECRFQIIGFGSTYQALFPEPVDYNDANVEKALEYQRSLVANMGGTEVLPALTEAFKSPLTGVGWYKQIIFFTDGDVGNADEVIGLVRSNVQQARIFAIGIGTGASTYLINGVARAGRGVATFIRDGNQMRAATMKVLNAALQPRASQIKVQWELTAVDPSGKLTPVEVISAPQQVPPVFNNCFATVYGVFDYDHRCTLSGQISLECEVFGKQQTFRINVSDVIANRLLSANVDLPLHRLCGKCQLNELSDRHKAIQMAESDSAESEQNPELKELRAQIERLSCALNVISPFTAFIGVDPVKREPVKLAPPPSRSNGFHGRARLCAMPMAAPSAMLMAARCASPMTASCAMPMAAPCAMPMGGTIAAPGARKMHCMKKKKKAVGSLDTVNQSVEFASNQQGTPMFDSSCLLKCEIEPQPAVKADLLLQLVELQSTDGSWTLNSDLADCLNIPLASIKAALPKSWPDASSPNTPVSESVWATMLALACFEVKLSDRFDEWTLLARKANTWLKKQAALAAGSADGTSKCCDKLMQLAKHVLQSNQKAA